MISCGGTNLQSLINQLHMGHAKIDVVISNRKDAHGLERARQVNIDTLYISCKTYPTVKEFIERLLMNLKNVELNWFY